MQTTCSVSPCRRRSSGLPCSTQPKNITDDPTWGREATDADQNQPLRKLLASHSTIRRYSRYWTGYSSDINVVSIWTRLVGHWKQHLQYKISTRAITKDSVWGFLESNQPVSWWVWENRPDKQRRSVCRGTLWQQPHHCYDVELRSVEIRTLFSDFQDFTHHVCQFD